MPTVSSQALKDLLTEDPDNKGFSALLETAQDEEIAHILNAPLDTVLSYAPIADLQAEFHKLVHQSGLPAWIVVRQQAASGENPAVKAVCQLVIDITEARYQNVDMGLPVVAASLDVMVQAGIISADTKTAMLELGRRPRSYAESKFGLDVKVTSQQIGAVR